MNNFIIEKLSFDGKSIKINEYQIFHKAKQIITEMRFTPEYDSKYFCICGKIVNKWYTLTESDPLKDNNIISNKSNFMIEQFNTGGKNIKISEYQIYHEALQVVVKMNRNEYKRYFCIYGKINNEWYALLNH